MIDADGIKPALLYSPHLNQKMTTIMDDLARIYLNQQIQSYQSLSPSLLRTRQLPNLPLNEVYVPLTLRIEAGFVDAPDQTPEPEAPVPQLLNQGGSHLTHLHSRERYLAQSEAGLSIDMLWKRGQQWVLLGAPGAGKTTLLHYLTLSHAQQLYNGGTGYFPIYVNLESFARRWQAHPDWSVEQAMLEYLQQILVPTLPRGNATFSQLTQAQQRQALFTQVARELQQRTALLLFDGLDTIHDADLRQRSSLAIDALLETYPGNRCLITARPISYQPGLYGHSFRAAVLEPFSLRQIHQFFQQWLQAIEKQKGAKEAHDLNQDAFAQRQVLQTASEFVSQLEQKPTISHYLRSPLLCALTGLIQQQVGDLPEHQVDLYRLYIEFFIEHWLLLLPADNYDDLLTGRELNRLLEDIALYLQEHCADNRSHASPLLEVAQDALKHQSPLDSAQIMDKIAQLQYLLGLDMGLLIHHGNEEYGFLHLAFQEYLAACAMTRSPQQIDRYLRHYLFNPHWQGIIRLAAAHQGMLNESLGSSFISMLQRYPHPRESDMHYTFRIAFQCLRDIQVSQQSADQMFQTAVHLYLTQPVLQPALNRLLKNIENLNYSPHAITPLFESLQHSESAVRAKTAELLGNLRDPNTLKRLQTLLREDEQATVRAKAAEALGQFRDADSVPLLLNTLREEKNFFVRHYAAQSLTKIADPQSLPTLLQQAQDEDPLLRSRSVEALGYLGDKRAVQLLLDSLRHDPQSAVRWRAAEALGHLKDSAACAGLLDSLNQESDATVRGRAAEALGYFKQAAVTQALINAAEKDTFPAVRWRAAESLGYLQDESALAVLRKTLRQDVDNAVRWSSAQALGRIKDRHAVNDLIAALREDYDPNVRWSAAEALGHLHDDSAVEALLKVLKYERYPLVRGKACEALGRLRNINVTQELLKVLDNAPEAVVRAHLVKGLGYLQDPAAIAPLMRVLCEDPAASVRWCAADALGLMKNPQAIPALLVAVRQDTELTVAWHAAQALELIDVGCLL